MSREVLLARLREIQALLNATLDIKPWIPVLDNARAHMNRLVKEVENERV